MLDGREAVLDGLHVAADAAHLGIELFWLGGERDLGDGVVVEGDVDHPCYGAVLHALEQLGEELHDVLTFRWIVVCMGLYNSPQCPLLIIA